jgi:Peptidase family M28
MKHFFITGVLVMISFYLLAQDPDAVITVKETERIEKILASDAMRGRKTFTPDIDRAADFIEAEFKTIGLQTWSNNSSYRQGFTLTPAERKTFGIPSIPGITDYNLANIVGVLPGKSRKDEYVVFSGHYDHIGVSEAVRGDSIYNGANDDAAGTTAVIMLAKYFKELNNNERTIVFVAFTGEEIGGLGSQYFSRQLDANKVVAMFNIEMIGTESKWGKNSAYITGYEKTNMGELLGKDLGGTGFTFYPDPYPEQDLFYRSDNATLARLGVPAHTISTSKMDVEPHYHKLTDHVETLDLENMTQVIKSIALSAKSIVAGTATPTRVKVEELH